MPICGITDDQLETILHDRLTPSKEINTPDRLFGREKHLQNIYRALNSQGRQIFIYGDRGVGKTSLAVTAAKLHTHEGESAVYVPCGETTSFADVIQAIGNSTSDVTKRLEQSRRTLGLNVGASNLGSLGGSIIKEPNAPIPGPNNINDALDILRYVDSKRKGQTIIVIDEFDRIKDPKEQALFSELIKNIPTIDLNVRFIFCGIGQNVDDLLGAHPSSGRYFEAIELEKLRHNFLWDIILSVAKEANVEIHDGMLKRISIISDGFPHYVHLIGECMFWAMQDSVEEIHECNQEHYEAGIRGALQKAEPSLRLDYQKATEKTKNKTQYEETLWAFADRSDSRRQVTEIYERSYLRIMDARQRKPLEKSVFNNRLLAMRENSHGKILVGHGSGWFSFRANVLRGYIRLKAEVEGVCLHPDPM